LSGEKGKVGNQISKLHSYGRSCIAGCECGSFRSRRDRVVEKLGKLCKAKNTDGERDREKERKREKN